MSEESYVPVSNSDASSASQKAAEMDALVQQNEILEEEKLQLMSEKADQSSRIAELENSQKALKRQCAELQVAVADEQGKAVVRCSGCLLLSQLPTVRIFFVYLSEHSARRRHKHGSYVLMRLEACIAS